RPGEEDHRPRRPPCARAFRRGDLRARARARRRRRRAAVPLPPEERLASDRLAPLRAHGRPAGDAGRGRRRVEVRILGVVRSGETTLLGALMLYLARGGGAESGLAFHDLEGEHSFRDLASYSEVLEKGGWPPRTSTSRVEEYTIVLREKTTGRVLELKLPE